MLNEMGKRAKDAARVLSVTDTAAKDRALLEIAAALETKQEAILAANEEDMARALENGMSEAFRDRLKLTVARIADVAESLRALVELPDPVGRVQEAWTMPNGLRIERVSVPLGVIAVIFEARPNVTADAAGLCLKSGNACILRGGSDAIASNKAMADAMRGALATAGLPPDCIQLVTDTSREAATALMRLHGYVDVIIPRGGADLIKSVVQNATVPVIETGAGTCHVYVDKDADMDMAAKIIFNAKTSRPSVCNAVECMLLHQDIAEEALPVIAAALAEKDVEIRGDAGVMAILQERAKPATDADWGKEYGDYIIAARIVSNLEAAMEHIFRYGTGHSECIVTENEDAAARFLDGVDAAAVYHNVSTRFTDGGEFGFGAEIGISTQKLHARGPLGLRELTAMKYKIYGDGQVR